MLLNYLGHGCGGFSAPRRASNASDEFLLCARSAHNVCLHCSMVSRLPGAVVLVLHESAKVCKQTLCFLNESEILLLDRASENLIYLSNEN